MLDTDKLHYIKQNFAVDTANSNQEEFWLDIPGIANVLIRKESDTLNIAVFHYVTQECVTELKVDYNSIMET